MEEVYTPGATTIGELCRQVGCSPEGTMKTMFYALETGKEPLVVAAFIPGHLPISLSKLGRALGGVVRRATPEELARSVGEVAGFCGPVGLPSSVLKVADPSVLCASSLVVGANRVDYHLRGALYGRDFEADRTADLIELVPGGACPSCGSTLGAESHRILGFAELPDRPDPAAGISVRDREGTRIYPHLLRGELFLERILTAILEGETKGGATE
jgi:prolyl-tRNA synthetase